MTLIDNAFAVLGAKPTDNRFALNNKADVAALLGGGETDDALNQLMQLNRRISAELAWLPGADPAAADAFLEYARTVSAGKPARIPPVEGLGTALAQANALAALFDIWPANNEAMFSALCRALDAILSQVTAAETLQAINADRQAGSWEPIPDEASLSDPLNERLRALTAPVRRAAEAFPELDFAAMLKTVLGPDGIDPQGSVALALMDAYTIRVHDRAEELKQQITPEAARLLALDSIDQNSLSKLFAKVEKWESLTAPLRLVPGNERSDARSICQDVRNVVVNYVNKASTVKRSKFVTIPMGSMTRRVTIEYQTKDPAITEARSRTQWLMKNFSEQTELVAQLMEDDKTLDQLQRNEAKMLQDAEAKARNPFSPNRF